MVLEFLLCNRVLSLEAAEQREKDLINLKWEVI
jgi:hypothetical protein